MKQGKKITKVKYPERTPIKIAIPAPDVFIKKPVQNPQEVGIERSIPTPGKSTGA